MSDFLATLLDRTLGSATPIQRYRPSRFEPVAEAPPAPTPLDLAPPVTAEQRLDGPPPAPPSAPPRSGWAEAPAAPRPPTGMDTPPPAAAWGRDRAEPQASPPPPSIQRETIRHETRIERETHRIDTIVERAPPPFEPAPSPPPRAEGTPITAPPPAAAPTPLRPAPNPPVTMIHQAAPEAGREAPGEASRRVPPASGAALGAAAPVITRIAPPRPTEPQAAAAAAPPAPIEITIGRIEIRASQAAPAPPRPRQARGPALGLDAYLRQRGGGTP